MPAYEWPTVPLTNHPRWHRGYLPIDPHTGKPLDVGDEPIGCTTHGIAACGTCSGTVEPWEPPDKADRYVVIRTIGAGIVTGPARPAVTFHPQGHGTTGALERLNGSAPRNDHAFGTARTTRNGNVVTGRKPKRKPKPAPTQPKPLPGGASPTTVDWAHRLGISL